MSEVQWIEDQAEFQAVLDSQPYVVVDFTAPSWCAPCRKFAPHFDTASEKSDATFVAVDIDRAPWATVAYGIQSVPAIKFFVDGEFAKDLVKDAKDKTVIKLLNEISNF